MTSDLPARFHELFAGLDRAHGSFKQVPGAVPDARGKLKGKQAVERTPPTLELWAQHLAGELGLGVFMLRDDATVRFAAIDVDIYQLDHARLVRALAARKLPLTCCVSKSGGAHLYLFGAEDLPAALVRRRLAEWAGALGLHALIKRKEDKVELFPVTDQLRGGLGNYLNMPYFGQARWAVAAKGRKLTPAEFLAAVPRVTVAQLQELALADGELFADGPPCLQALTAAGPVTAYRDNALVDIGVYVKLRWPDSWREKLEEYHRRLFPDPLSAADVLKCMRSVEKKSYNYMCEKEPIASRCQKKVCLGRALGVRGAAEANGQEVGFNLNLGPLTKFTTSPPLWELEVDGEVLRLTTDQLLAYQVFRRQVMERLNKLPVKLKQESWDEILAEKLETLTIVEAPPDAGDAGQVRFHLERFCTQLTAVRREELKEGRAWWTEQGEVWFRLPLFQEYLGKQRVFVKPRDLTALFRAWSFTPGELNIRGVCVRYWAMPAFDRQVEADDVPRPGRDSRGRM